MESTGALKWQKSIGGELERVKKTLGTIGFELEESQPHLSGERFLMTKEKLVLIGKRISDDEKVVIKISNHNEGIKEIEHEKNARNILRDVSFSEKNILFPKDIYYGEKDGFLILITEFIAQERVFVAHTLEEQFFMILKTFEAIENFHATTFEHIKTIKYTFPIFYAQEYFKNFESFRKTIAKNYKNTEIEDTLSKSENFLRVNKAVIDRYANYLTHTDLVPHNFRVKDGHVYLLDTASVRFGNKYEGWARFLNYMVIHNPALEKLLVNYIKTNRGVTEYLNLRLMRVYKITELLEFYSRSLPKTDGDLRALTIERIGFWHNIMKAILDDITIEEELVKSYTKKRDELRTEEEKERQREFAVA